VTLSRQDRDKAGKLKVSRAEKIVRQVHDFTRSQNLTCERIIPNSDHESSAFAVKWIVIGSNKVHSIQCVEGRNELLPKRAESRVEVEASPGMAQGALIDSQTLRINPPSQCEGGHYG